MMKLDDGSWVCGSCGHEKPRNAEAEAEMVTTQGQVETEVVDTSDVSTEDIGPTTAATCPKCGHDRAFWEMKQIRAADESETRFFTCTECGHKWREDDH